MLGDRLGRAEHGEMQHARQQDPADTLAHGVRDEEFKAIGQVSICPMYTSASVKPCASAK
ncbi:hypothetical protein GCM10029976_059430 [Kribbella albertanoniae]